MTTIADGWKYYASGDTTGISALNYFGLIKTDKKGPIGTALKYNIIERELYGQYYPTLGAGSTYADGIAVNFVPVNGLPLYWMLGKVTDSAGTKTITNIDGTQHKPHLTLWQNTDAQKYHYFNYVVGKLSLQWEKEGYLSCSINGKAGANATDVYNPTFTFPDDSDDNQIYSYYSHINSMTWNSTSITPLRLTLELDQELNGFPDTDGNYYSEIADQNIIKGIYHLQFTSTDVANLITDAEAQTTRSFEWRIDKAANDHYLEFTQNAKMESLIPTRDLEQGLQIWDVIMKTEAVSVECVDDLINSFYQLA